jgi:hypothetical protein
MDLRQLARDFNQSRYPRPEHVARLVQPFLEPGEHPRHVFAGSTHRGFGEFWAVAVTDDSILVVEASTGVFQWSRLRPSQSFRFHRNIRIGPPIAPGWYVLEGQRLLVIDDEYEREIAAADAELDFNRR